MTNTVTMTKEELVVIARGMSADDQAFIVASLGPEVEHPQLDADGWARDVSTEVRAELLRRIAAHDADPSRGITLEQLKARLAAER